MEDRRTEWVGADSKGRMIPVEPRQQEKRTLTVEANVPADALYKTYHMPGRFHPDHYAVDLLNDILSNGQSSRLIHQLVKEKEIFTSISSHGMGSIDPGLLVVSGRLNDGVSLENAEIELDKTIKQVVSDGVSETELEKVKNQAESLLEFEEVEVMNRAMNLAFAALSGDPNLVNLEAKLIRAVTTTDIRRVAAEIFREENASVLYYKAVKS